MEKLHTIGEVAEMLRISKPSVYRLMSSGQLKSVKIGGRTLFKETELERFVNSLEPQEKSSWVPDFESSV